MEHPCFVGIDVSKAHLDVYVRPSGESFRVGHDDAGFVTLIARMRPLTPTVVVLEATGGYEVTVAVALAGARLPVAVVNPRQIRDFARATGQLAKTDALDARMIAFFAEAVRPIARPCRTNTHAPSGTGRPPPATGRHAQRRTEPPPPAPGSRPAAPSRGSHRLAGETLSSASRRTSRP